MNDRLKFRVWDIEEKTYKSSDYALLKMFNIFPVDDWQKSLRKVGN